MTLGLNLFGVTEEVAINSQEEAMYHVFAAKQKVRDFLKQSGYGELTDGDLRLSFDMHMCFNIHDHNGRPVNTSEVSLCLSGNVTYSIVFKISAIRISRWAEGSKHGKALRQWQLTQNTFVEFIKNYEEAIEYQKLNRSNREKN